jgi:hypothetical protein
MKSEAKNGRFWLNAQDILATSADEATLDAVAPAFAPLARIQLGMFFCTADDAPVLGHFRLIS